MRFATIHHDHTGLSSGCTVISTQTEITYEQCLLQACNVSANALRFREKTCVAMHCEDDNLLLMSTPDDTGWHIAVIAGETVIILAI